MKYSNLLLIAGILLFGCQQQKPKEEESSKPNVSLQKAWETDTTLLTPESVIFDPSKNVLYVSCINGVPPDTVDGDGYIAKVSAEDGSIIDSSWVDGMDAPKGLGLYQGKLYVSDINKVLEIDTESGEITNTITIDTAKFLNDVDVDANGVIYTTDSRTNTVYSIQDGQVSVWFSSDKLGGVNGVMIEGDQAMLAGFQAGKLWSTPIAQPEVTEVADSMFNADGIEKIGDAYLVSSWSGQAYYVDADGATVKILDTQDDGENAADIDYIADRNLMLVPAFFANKVVAYEVTVK